MSIHPDLQDKILFYLQMRRPQVKREVFAVEHVREGAEHILEGFNQRYKKSRHSYSSRSTSSAPTVKARYWKF